MTKYYAFIDESGNHSLNTDKEGTSKYFIVLAILVRVDVLEELRNEIEALRVKYFKNSEIKSNKLSDDRREKIFNDLSEIDFKFYAVAVNKQAIKKDSGLRYHKSFIKYANNRLYESLLSNFSDITIRADGHGNAEFIESFKKYIENKNYPDLFSESNLEIVNSEDEILVQLADLIVGTLAKLYEDRLSNEYRIKFIKFLKDKRIRVDEWPPKFEYFAKEHTEGSKFDNIIYETSVKAAQDFLEKNSDTLDEEVRIQHATISYLLFKQRFCNDDFSTAAEIITHLKGQGFFEMNKQAFRSKIISKLRDKNVIIAATGKGLKIPTCYTDIVDFANLVDGIVFPLLNRLHIANDILKLASLGKLNFLDEPRFVKLQRIIEGFEK
jgi:Protein of unknown function (DUF3800)